MTSPAPTKTAVFPVPVSEFEMMNRYPEDYWQRRQYELWNRWDEEKELNSACHLLERLVLKTKASDDTFVAFAKITDIKTNNMKNTWWFRIFELDGQQVNLYCSYVTGFPMPENIGLGTIRPEPWPMQQ